jgi:hypothetical protein
MLWRCPLSPANNVLEGRGQLSKEMNMEHKQAKDQTKATEDADSARQVPEGQPLTDHDLDVVTGGAARRGPGTQTEDDAFVG